MPAHEARRQHQTGRLVVEFLIVALMEVKDKDTGRRQNSSLRNVLDSRNDQLLTAVPGVRLFNTPGDETGSSSELLCMPKHVGCLMKRAFVTEL